MTQKFENVSNNIDWLKTMLKEIEGLQVTHGDKFSETIIGVLNRSLTLNERLLDLCVLYNERINIEQFGHEGLTKLNQDFIKGLTVLNGCKQ